MTNRKTIKIYDKEYSSLLKYPFKSKYKYVSNIEKEPYIPDYRLKTCKKMSKPNFSNERGCWEIDLMFVSYYNSQLESIKQTYLVLINVNTRFLIIEPLIYEVTTSSREVVENKSIRKEIIDEEVTMSSREVVDQKNSIKNIINIQNALFRIMNKYFDFEFDTFKCDGESSFKTMYNNNLVIETSKKRIIISDINQTLKDANYRGQTNRDQIIDDLIKNHNKKVLKKYIKINYQLHTYLRKLYKDFNLYNDKHNHINDFYSIKLVINSSPYTLSHKTVDSVIRTIRNAFGLDNRRLADYNLMRQMIDYYNNTPHISLRFKNYDYDSSEFYDKGLTKQTKYIYYTPFQVQINPDLEWRYIRKMKLKLQDIKEEQRLKGLLSYKLGNIILVHLELDKTQKKHEKRRRVFNEIAQFIKYENGNVICKLLNNYKTFNKDKNNRLTLYNTSNIGRKPKTDNEKAIIEVPIIYTKFVCNNIDDLNNDYRSYFVLK